MPGETTTKKYLQIAEQIRQEIVSGTYAEGQMIPTIREMARRYGVNPQTVNKATAHLASLGYIRSRQGSGSEVVRPPEATNGGVYMLIDENRSRYLEDMDDPRNYHGKDIYLTYLLRMSNEGRRSKFLVYGPDDEAPRDDIVEAISEVSGFLVQGSLPPLYVKLLSESNVPTVLINRTIPEIFSQGRVASVLIGLDRFSALVDYIVTLGHRKILFVRAWEFERNDVYEERFAALSQGINSWKHEYDIHVEEFTFDANAGECIEAMRNYVDAGFTAAIGYNDGSALQLYSLVQRIGMNVGNDFSICGFDDISAARLATPPLTTVRVDRGRLVREAFNLLEELKSSGNGVSLSRVLDTELTIRRSALPPARTIA